MNGAQTYSPEITALSRLESDTAIAARLRDIASGYGKVLSVATLGDHADDHEHFFLVSFDRVQDAIAASLELRCCLFGQATLVVHLPRPPATRQ